MKKLVTLILCVCMLLSAVGCAQPAAAPAAEPATEAAPAAPATDAAAPAADAAAPAAAPAGRQPELVINMKSEPSNLDVVAETNDDGAVIMLGGIYEQLVNVAADNTIVCELAESYEISDDKTQYTYKLRQGVKFHDGQEMVAEDVVASMNRWLDLAGTANNMVGGARFEAVDDYTVTIKMAAGTAYLNEVIASFGQHAIITTKECVDEALAAEDGMIHTYVGTGPYTWGEWVSASHVTLNAYEDYQPYGAPGDYSGMCGYKTAYYDKITLRFVTDLATINAGMQTGEYKATSGLDMSYYDSYANDQNFKVRTDDTELNAMIFNKAEGWGANPKFRQAVQTLINVDDVMYGFFGNDNFYKLYSSYMFDSSTWYTENGSECYNQANKEKALELFAEAGFTKDDTFIILCASDSPDFYAFAQIIQQEFAEIGMKCELLAYEWGTFADIRNNQPKEYNAFITSFSPKIMPNLNLFLSATWAGWCTDERIQKDLAAVASATDKAEGMKIWDELQGYMYREYVPVVKLGVSLNLTVWAADMDGFEYHERLIWVNAHPAA